jgi:hypothetical protein
MASTGQKRLSDESRILALFGDPKASYSRADVKRLTRTASRDLDAVLDDHDVVPGDDGMFQWDDVAFIALYERWGVRRIASVLLRNEREVPRLNQLATIRVQLPLYQLRALQEEAARKSAACKAQWNVSDVVTTVLSAWIVSAAGGVEETEAGADLQNADHWPLPSPGTTTAERSLTDTGTRVSRRKVR